MTLRLLRSAEWQIGRIYAQFESDDASAPFEAHFKAVERLAARAAGNAVDAALVAGDGFDPQTVSDKTVRRAFNAMQAYAGCRASLDGEPTSGFGRRSRMPKRAGVARRRHTSTCSILASLLRSRPQCPSRRRGHPAERSSVCRRLPRMSAAAACAERQTARRHLHELSPGLQDAVMTPRYFIRAGVMGESPDGAGSFMGR